MSRVKVFIKEHIDLYAIVSHKIKTEKKNQKQGSLKVH